MGWTLYCILWRNKLYLEANMPPGLIPITKDFDLKCWIGGGKCKKNKEGNSEVPVLHSGLLGLRKRDYLGKIVHFKKALIWITNQNPRFYMFVTDQKTPSGNLWSHSTVVVKLDADFHILVLWPPSSSMWPGSEWTGKCMNSTSGSIKLDDHVMLIS